MTKKIRLRGHHIEALAEKYFDEGGFFHIERGKSPAQIRYERMLQEYRRDFGDEAYEKFIAKSNSKLSLLGYDYDKKQKEKDQVLSALEKDWLSNPNLEIKVVVGSDSLCRACPEGDTCCGARDEITEVDIEQDRTPISEYGLEEGETYTMKDIIAKFRDYFDRTQFPSPRTKNGFGREEWDKIVRVSK